ARHSFGVRAAPEAPRPPPHSSPLVLVRVASRYVSLTPIGLLEPPGPPPRGNALALVNGSRSEGAAPSEGERARRWANVWHRLKKFASYSIRHRLLRGHG